MSFVLNPTALKTPRMPGMNIRDFWTGIDQDRNLFAYYVSAQNFNTYIMTENFVGYLFKNCLFTRICGRNPVPGVRQAGDISTLLQF